MILENLKKFIDFKGISIAAFEKSIGMSNNSFRKSLNTGGNLGSDKLENILKVYSDINPNWLLTGNGEMLITFNSNSENCNPNCNPNCNLSEKNEDKKTQASYQLDIAYSNIAAEPPAQYGKNIRSDNLSNIIRDLVDQIKEQSEEIGALKQENIMLKSQLAQRADDANAKCVPA